MTRGHELEQARLPCLGLASLATQVKLGSTPDRLKPVLNWVNVCSPNILRTVRRTMIRFLIELLVRRAWFGQFDELCFVLKLACNEMQASARTCGRRAADSMIENVGLNQVKSVYFNRPSQGNSTNYYFILGPPRQGCASHKSTNKQIPSEASEEPSNNVVVIFISSSSTGELCSQPVRGNVRRIGRMFPEHVERSFLDPEYRFAKKSSPS